MSATKEIENILVTPLSRRSFFGASLVFFSALSAACKGSEKTATPIASPLSTPEVENGVDKLKTVVESLNPSPIKDLLIQRVLRYYQNPRSQFVELAGVRIPIFDSGVDITIIDRVGVGGAFSSRKSNKAPFEVLYPTKATFTLIPLVDLFAEVETNAYPQIAKLADGIRVISINFSPQTPTYEGVYPRISMQRPNPRLVKPDDQQFYQVNEGTVLVKEACANLLYEILLEETIKKMQQYNLPTSIEVRKANGSITQSEIVNQALTLISGPLGRSQAILDLASYLVGFKAISGTVMGEEQFQAPYIREVLGPTKDMNLGNSPEAILANSFHWVLANPSALKLPHVGDLNRIP